MPDIELTPWQRLVLAFWALFAVLFRADVAREVERLRALRRGRESLPPGPGARPEPARPPEATVPPPSPTVPAKPSAAPPSAAAPPPPAAAPPAPAPVPAKPAVPAEPAKVAPAAEAAKAAPAPAAARAVPAAEPTKPAPAPAVAAAPSVPDTRAALQVLSILQREGRLVDFIEENLAGFPDAAIGAAARTVHAGCKRAIEELFRLEPVFREAEGAQVTVPTGFDPAAIRLTGNVVGKPPFKGSLKHHGWRAREVKLPPVDGKDPNILAPAEVEL